MILLKFLNHFVMYTRIYTNTSIYLLCDNLIEQSRRDDSIELVMYVTTYFAEK